ncbi:MAG: hypothetical protein O2779_05640 [Nanoarchaeota archaeon]|nr:hypothetical protein [Nanoarchaeota archaeon]
MNQQEHNTIISFQRARADIMKLKEEIYALQHQQSSIVATISVLQEHNTILIERLKAPQKVTLNAPVAKKTNGNGKKTFVASKTATKFHIKNCPFAQNIKPKSNIIFKTKNSALNKGFKPCKCIQ